MPFPTRYNPNPMKLNFGKEFWEESKTKQSFKDECDINSIMRRYVNQGVLPTNVKVGTYGDFSAVGDYMESLAVLDRAKQQFAALPSAVRERFGNNPARMLEFVADKGNLEEARKLGLLKEVPNANVTPAVEPVVSKDAK